MKVVFTHTIVAVMAVSATLLTQHYLKANSGSPTKVESALTNSMLVSELTSDISIGSNNSTKAVIDSPDVHNSEQIIEDPTTDPIADILSDDVQIYAPNSLNDMLSQIGIDTLSSQEIGSHIETFNNWLGNNNTAAREIFDYLASDINEDAKHVMQYMVAMSHDPDLARNLVSELSSATEKDYPIWESILSVADIATADARNGLLTILPNISSPALISASLRSMPPAVLPSGERARFLSELAIYIENTDENVRAAAIDSLGAWSAHDYSHLISNELSNGTEKTKTSAIQAVANGNLHSAEIRNGLTSILTDDTASFQMRLEAFNVLTRFPLESADHDLHYRFYEQHILPLQVLGNSS